MSRIGNRVLNIPAGVEVNIDGNKVTTKGPKGTLEFNYRNDNVDVKVEVGDFFKARHLQPLPVLNGGDEVRCLKQAVVGAGVEPCHTTPHLFYRKAAFVEVESVEVGDFQLAACRRFERFGFFDHVTSVKV